MKKRITICLVLVMLFFNVHAGNYLYQPEQGVVCQWNTADIAGVYTKSGTRIKFWVNEVGQGGHKASITANGWTLAGNTFYYAYAPYISDFSMHSDPITALPVSYRGQHQKENGAMSHLTQYDYMRGMTTTTASTADFALSHYGSVMHITYELPKDMTVTSLKIMSDDNVLPVSAVMNLPLQSLTVTEYGRELTLQMDNVELAEGEVLDAFLMLPPVNLTGKCLTFEVEDAVQQTRLQVVAKGCNITAGKLYEVMLSPDLELQDKEPLAPVDGRTVQSSLLLPCATVTDFVYDEAGRFSPLEKGDVNKDGKVNVVDAVMLNGYYLNNETDGLSLPLCDMDDNGVINVVDVVAIINKYLNPNTK